MAVVIDGGALSVADVAAVARDDAQVRLGPGALSALANGRKAVDELAASQRPVYGVSTGFGALAARHIPAEARAASQRAIVVSHAAGMGPEVEREVVRAMMTLRLRTLATGHTGVRPEVAEALAGLLNAGITPLVYEHGSLGCSGDLAPLAHVALVLTGQGAARGPDGRIRPAGDLLAEHGLVPVELAEKEGLALINGTDGMLGMLALALTDLAVLLTTADVSASLTVEALLGSDRPFAPATHQLRPHPGQAVSADNMRRLLAGSPLVAAGRGDRVQDAYSLRCAPQVTGAARDTAAFAGQVADRELASAIDNPVVLDDGRVESNGNFHGAPLGFVLDYLAIAVAEVGSIAERRTDRMLDVARSHGLPAFLAADPGVDSGMMIAHYTQAAMVAENRRLAAPASVDSIPTSAMQEDHVSMGWGAARKLRSALDNLARILAVELVVAARAVDLRAPIAPGAAGAAVIAALREQVAGAGPDRFLAPDLAAAAELVRTGAPVRAATSVVGGLG